MITGVTESGFEYQLDDDMMDDYELLEILCDIDNGNTALVTKAARLILGDAQLEALKSHLRGSGKRVPASKMIAEVTQIINGNSTGKNS